MDLAEDTDEGRLLSWYKDALVRRFDLIGDYAGNELFLIEGDSALLHCFSTSNVDFGGGFQILHAVHAVETFLQALLLRRCNFHLVFFDQHKDLCVPPGTCSASRHKFLLTREILIRHMQMNLRQQRPAFDILLYSSIQSNDFSEYLANTDVYFFLCHDGASSESPNASKNPREEENDFFNNQKSRYDKMTSVGFNPQPFVKTMFRFMIYEFIRRGYGVALVNGAEWKDSKVLASVIEGYGKSLPALSMDSLHHRTENEWPSSMDFREELEDLLLAEDLTEREILTIVVISGMMSYDHSSCRRMQASAFLLHTAILNMYPLSARRFQPPPLQDGDEAFLLQFAQLARRVLLNETYGQILGGASRHCNIVDLVDGRVFRAVTHTSSHPITSAMNGQQYWPKHQRLVVLAESICKIDLRTSSTQFSSIQAAELGTPVQPVKTQYSLKESKVLPFGNVIFDSHLAPISLAIEDGPSEDGHSASTRTFKELSHWHNSEKRLGHKIVPARLGFFAHKRNQRLMAEMMAYAASLTNSAGKTLEPQTVVVSQEGSDQKSQKKIKEKESRHVAKKTALQTKPKSKSAGPKKGKEAAHAEAAAIRARKANTKEQQLLAFWRSRCKDLEKKHPSVRYSEAKKYSLNLGSSELAMVGSDVELYLVGVLASMWTKCCQNKRKDQDIDVVALLWHHLTRLISMTGLTHSMWSKVELTVKCLALPKIRAPALSTPDRPLSFVFPLNTENQIDLNLPMNPLEFQLLHCGPYFDRSMDSRPDGRVPFEPDGWQRKVLDAIDAHKSLFVVAPTSAGKTFISFYAMKQVLESSDNDILVYVAPTKALVNQISAEIQARFSKSYAAHQKRSVWAIHTRDHRINDPTGCQILVTVPHILQIMLLAPTNAETKSSWSRRVTRIIFDEVHCIGQAEDGIVWEQLLMLAPCPIIALSATVGNPQEFNDWLKCTQAAIGHDLVMIKHLHRYSDLRKFIYVPPRKFCFKGLVRTTNLSVPGLDANCYSTGGFAFVHPAGSLIHRSRGIPEDLSLEARDCFILWRTMSAHQTGEFKLAESLSPSEALPEIIRKTDIISWDVELKKVLKWWMGDPKSPFEAVQDNLQATVIMEREDIYVSGKCSAEDLDEAVAVDQMDLCSTTLSMLSALHNKDALPAILFSYDRGMCEEICEKVLEQLKTAEASWKASSPEWATKLADYERWQKLQRQSDAKRVSAKRGKKTRDSDDDDRPSRDSLQREATDAEGSIWDTFDIEAPIERFSFSDNKKLPASELKEYEKQLLRQQQPQWLLEALQRGIGVHHAGLNRRYRQTVEVLFRRGYLRVVIATGTLALGINMPCKTVVFSGDSIFLTALNFRQAAGRAGRRGFDLLGNVVFQGIPRDKVYRLLSSRLPDLNGHFPISTTLVLRLFSLLHESKNSDFAVRAINSLLSQPRLYLGGPESKMTVLHHLRFSIEYLRRQFLLGVNGEPLNFAGCVSHLYFTENSAFAFHALLKEGYLHEVCAGVDRNPERVSRTLMLVMAHLFGRMPCRQANKEWIKSLVSRSPSVVFLPPLPDKGKAVLRKHNQDILDIFKTYVKTFVEQHVQAEDCRLPLTGMKCGGDGPVSTDSPLTPLPSTKLRSPFVALSGYDDNFESISDLCRSVRSDVILEESVIPHISIFPSESGGHLNAYLYDFFRHGSVEALRKANGIRKGDVWFLLNDFSIVLATIITSLKNFIKPGQNGDMAMIDIQGGGETYNAPKLEASQDHSDTSDDETEGEDDEDSMPSWEVEGEKSLLQVLRAFQILRNDFDSKFKAMWA